MILTEDAGRHPGIRPGRVGPNLRYAEMPREVTLAQLRGLRTANLRLWGSLSPTQLARVGVHSERGPESLDLLLRLMGAHDLVHRRQIERVLAVGEGART